jgi:hypothetical protein
MGSAATPPAGRDAATARRAAARRVLLGVPARTHWAGRLDRGRSR